MAHPLEINAGISPITELVLQDPEGFARKTIRTTAGKAFPLSGLPANDPVTLDRLENAEYVVFSAQFPQTQWDAKALAKHLLGIPIPQGQDPTAWLSAIIDDWEMPYVERRDSKFLDTLHDQNIPQDYSDLVRYDLANLLKVCLTANESAIRKAITTEEHYIFDRSFVVHNFAEASKQMQAIYHEFYLSLYNFFFVFPNYSSDSGYSRASQQVIDDVNKIIQTAGIPHPNTEEDVDINEFMAQVCTLLPADVVDDFLSNEHFAGFLILDSFQQRVVQQENFLAERSMVPKVEIVGDGTVRISIGRSQRTIRIEDGSREIVEDSIEPETITPRLAWAVDKATGLISVLRGNYEKPLGIENIPYASTTAGLLLILNSLPDRGRPDIIPLLMNFGRRNQRIEGAQIPLATLLFEGKVLDTQPARALVQLFSRITVDRIG